ncbi:hypothetical protein CROQUDRAFT_55778 [Cronartium quercuum f. sp. fusiforme G11]|uniref:Secreted protein n=1 Tax=Cronartium quercuum f. sp. fusiforme G11 TaxID=708437 RepID=A0A9P6TI57_9BASI|nr:hypothetical protein CROQUDRAFT_55778 [Cronartium quercuum f. sp. fusiforme G11]
MRTELISLILCTVGLASAQRFLQPRQNAAQLANQPTYTITGSGPATVSGIPTNTATSGEKAVTVQIKSDAHAAIEAFGQAMTGAAGNSTTQSSKETAQLFQTLVKGALSYPLNQNIGGSATPSQDRLNAMAAAINTTLNSIQDTATKILSSSQGALHFNDLKECIGGLVQQGGLHDGESCVVNGMSVTGVSNLMSSVLKTFGDNGIPQAILKETSKALDPTFTAVLPGEKKFYDSVNNAITSVQASISGQLVAALNDAQNCFQDAMTSASAYPDKMAATQKCMRSPTGKSVYTDLKTLYLSVTNQFVGYLTPNVLDSVHTIADSYLNKTSQTDDQKYFSNAIASTTSSIVASNAGNQVTYAYKLADCLDTLVGTTDPSSASNIAATHNCLKKPDGPAASVKQIVYGYIQQIYGVLPASLASKIEATGVKNLDPKDPNYASKVEALHQTFLKTNVGPEYVTCYEAFVDCLFDSSTGALENPGNTHRTCLLGNSCKTTPDGQKNLAVPIGRRALSTHHISARKAPQQVHVVRRYSSTPKHHYLLESFASTMKSL